MNSSAKLHLGSAGYCALLIGLNWFRSVEYSRQFGVKSESFGPVALAALLSLAVLVYLVYRCVRAALTRLERGGKLREGRWIVNWGVLLYALPLLWHQNSSSSWLEPDGTWANATGGYGHPLSAWVFLFAILGLLLVQILARLTSNDDGAGAGGSDHPGASPLRA